MKKLIIILCLLPALSCAQPVKHDFAYYEQKTRELLPILGINDADITFAATHKDISFEQRMKNPKTIFLDIEKFTQLPEHAALLECVLQAQLATVDWNQIIPRKKTFLEIHDISLSFAAVYTAPLIMSIYVPPNPNLPYFFPGLTAACGALLSCWIGYYEYTTAMTDQESTQKINFEREHYIKLDTLYSLLAHENTILLAFIGLDHNFDRFGTNSALFEFVQWVQVYPEKWQAIKPHLSEKTVTRIEHTATILQFLAPLQDWIQSHPDEWQEIKKTLPPEIKALFKDKSSPFSSYYWPRPSHPIEF